ncbi:GNAT family N-acetyltransferase [Halorientalis halophila]|uniref:GNAT family N-acetyltransferase n=1 Tax=Halorientalis halophila TaxID=3108499 RepID=UPI00300B74DB
MSVEIREATQTDRSEWNGYVEQSPWAGLFHRREVIDALARHTDATPTLLVGFKGQEPVGIFPVFELRKGPVSAAVSPPPDVRVPYLGPAPLNVDGMKQRKAERRQRRFLEGCLDWIDEMLDPAYVHLRLHHGYPDLRPLTWEAFDVDPAYTYLVDLSVGREDLLDSFSRDARTNIRDGRENDDVTVEEGGRGDVPFVMDRVRRRYERQDVDFGLPTALVTDLYESLPEGAIRPYVCRVDGRRVGGILACELGDTISRWQGGVKTDLEVDASINDLLDWRVMADAVDRGLTTYDLVGANNQRINDYKAKFNPELQQFYSVERGSTVMTLATGLYQRLRGTTGSLSPVK